MLHRRLARDYETHPHRSEAMIHLAMTDPPSGNIGARNVQGPTQFLQEGVDGGVVSQDAGAGRPGAQGAVGDGQPGRAGRRQGVGGAGEVLQAGQEASPGGDGSGDVTSQRVQLAGDGFVALDAAGTVLAELDVPLRHLLVLPSAP
ncbi:hypothetical protein M2163_000072 [Streptomyces sp. SAI-135]|jgi:hypothetical protein|nr:hypothetical protein [Streptomyces sp. SAI-090]MDH6555045.1 hypothetical protein [Streptomyces sp. SAI-041]MDH6574310.1 hypothetical protein [Streptomyces sp. SAI-117]MDH6580958.1 hypothetical protein [Streptomyces sp. SAI-133]MDH6612964.1 hypothetical protein [Streptomyces sp. SAI-135]